MAHTKAEGVDPKTFVWLGTFVYELYTLQLFRLPSSKAAMPRAQVEHMKQTQEPRPPIGACTAVD